MTHSQLQRRELLLATAVGAGWYLAGLPRGQAGERAEGTEVNDVQSQLNATRVYKIIKPTTLDQLQAALVEAREAKRAISMFGGRHAMGGQQFGTDNYQLDLTGLNRVLRLDGERGLVTVEAGIQWPELIQELHRRQPDAAEPWTIREKQTGIDTVTLGGSLAANIHGRGLKYPPIVHDVESFQLLDAAGNLRACSRKENGELFALAIGGYGLFGIITEITLRLTRRFKVQRKVEIITLKDLPERLKFRLEEGCVFGDCQYSVDLSGDAESHPGVFPCYLPVPLDTPLTAEPKKFSKEDWARLYTLLRKDKAKAFEEYAAHYRQTNDQVYWSDTHQLAGEFVGHRAAVNAQEGTEMITEVYVTHENLLPFMERVRKDLAERKADLTYGTIRYIEADEETFLPWARRKSVCIVCNLHVRHTEEGIAKGKGDFQQILKRVVEFGGSFYLTYHRWATPDQIAACYPEIREFFRLKRKHDPHQLFQSDWYRHYQPVFA